MESSFFNRTVDETLSALGGTKAGLTSKEAAERLQKHGKNALADGKKKTGVQVFFEQFKDLLVVILIIAALISMVSDNVESTVVIFAVLILNAVLGTVQHFKAEKSLESLKAMSSPSAKVLRDGVRSVVPSAQVVPGDIVELEAGDMVVADGRILENFSLKVNESSLTGESEGVEKTSDVIAAEKVALGDQKNMVFSGSLVTYGRATVVVTGTGMDTELGKVAALMNRTQQRKTPLQESLDDFSKKLATAILGICVVVFALSLFHHMALLDSLMFAVALAVACAHSRHPLMLCMPATVPLERQQMLTKFGAQIVLSNYVYGRRGVEQRAQEAVEQTGGYFLNYFDNDLNAEFHRRVTGPNIAKATGGALDAVVAGVGSGGTITGVGEYIKAWYPDVKVVAVEPYESQAIGGGYIGRHNIPGLGAGFVLAAMSFLFRWDVVEEENAFASSGIFMAGLAYVPLLLLPATYLSTTKLIFIIAAVAISDTAAYFVGTRFGHHKLWPRVSPNKSSEGAVGSLAACVLFCAIYGQIYGKTGWFSFALLGIAVNAFAQLGDLFESALKRSVNVKDSGQILPGHGGMLDRADSLLFAMPMFAVVDQWFFFF